MRSIRNCVEVMIILIVFGAALYSQRVSISDWVRERTAPPLPATVEYVEVKENPSVIASPEHVDGRSNLNTEIALSPQPDVEDPRNDKKDEFNLAVPFTSQAPNGDWSLPYKEACEEASLYMVRAYYEGVKESTIDPEIATADLQKIIAFEKELFGYYEDTTAIQTGTIAELMYGYGQVEVIDNPTVEQIKAHVISWHPVIVPAAGRLLGNPFYTAPGPVYHMLVIRGYTADGKFITNDPGTKHGEAYLYDFDTVMNAMHDWNGGAEITEGKKVALVVYPE
jgi:hypothetical protein